MFTRLSHKIIAYFSILIIAMIMPLVLLLHGIVNQNHMELIKEEMHSKLNLIRLSIDRWESGDWRSFGKKKKLVYDISRMTGLRVTVVDMNGRVIADSDVEKPELMENHLYRQEIRDAISSGEGYSERYSQTLKKDLLYMASVNGNVVLRLAKPINQIKENLNSINGRITIVGLVTAAAGILLIVFLSRRVTASINTAILFARRFAEGDTESRIMNYSDDEIGILQMSLNRLADTIVEKINSLVFEQNKLKITLETISSGIAVIGTDRRIIISNSAFNGLFEYRRDPVGFLFFEVIRSRLLNAKIEYAVTGGKAVQFEERLVSGVLCDISIKPISEEGTLMGILVVLRDITEKKKIEQLKVDLVANMSHELKTPITIMKGYLETIYENINDSDMARDFIVKAIENADRQNALVNDILKLNMLETSGDVEFENVDLAATVKGCADLLAHKASRKNVKLSVNLGQDVLKVKGSAFLAEEIFFNLIDNAINYNRPGGVVEVSSEKEGSTTILRVRDDGIGIPEDSLDRVFERFFRVDKSRSRATGGTGLGLSIVKHAVELMGWKIVVSSSQPGGTVFLVKIES